MFRARRFYFTIVILGFTIAQLVISKSTSGLSKHSLIKQPRQSNLTAASNRTQTKTTKQLKDVNVRKTRSPQFTTAFNGFTRPGPIGLDQIGLPYSPRLSPLALQGTPNLPALGPNRNFLLGNNPLLANSEGFRLPYNIRLANLLSTINLLRQRSAIAQTANPAVLDLYKPKRLKYDAIPIKPDEYAGALSPSALSLLLGRSALGTQTTETQDDDDDGGDSGEYS